MMAPPMARTTIKYRTVRLVVTSITHADQTKKKEATTAGVLRTISS